MHMRVKQTAEYTGLSKSTLDKLRCFGGGPAYFKIGRSVVYSIPVVDEWMAERRRSTTWGGANDNQPAEQRRVAA